MQINIKTNLNHLTKKIDLFLLKKELLQQLSHNNKVRAMEISSITPAQAFSNRIRVDKTSLLLRIKSTKKIIKIRIKTQANNTCKKIQSKT